MEAHRSQHTRHRHTRHGDRVKYRRPRTLALGGGGRFYYLLVAAVAVLLAGYLGYRYLTADTEERRLRQLVYAAQTAIEAKDVSACVALLDETYTDNQHNDYKRIQQEARRELDHVNNVRVRIRNINVELVPNTPQAHVNFEMRFTATVDDGTGHSYPVAGVLGNHIPIGAVWERMRLECVRRGADWRISYAAVESLRQ